MESLNLGILAHVDAGKTSLTERLLYEAGVIDHLGSVDKGDTQTDTLPIERQRGITVRSAVVSFEIDDHDKLRPILRAFPVEVPVGVAFAKRSGMVVDGTSDEFEALAGRIAVFRFDPVTS